MSNVMPMVVAVYLALSAAGFVPAGEEASAAALRAENARLKKRVAELEKAQKKSVESPPIPIAASPWAARGADGENGRYEEIFFHHHEHEGKTGSENHPHGGLHFSHPMEVESPSPDTKIRLDYRHVRRDGGEEQANEDSVNLEFEYAFARWFSVELDVPYTFRDPESGARENNLDNIEVALKFANFAAQDKGLLLGYGLEFGLPSGDDKKGIGSNNQGEFTPFLDVGFKRKRLEVVSFLKFGIPFNQDGTEEAETELGYELSVLYHFHERVAGVLEVLGTTVLSGAEDGNTVLEIAPGVKFKPWAARPKLELGINGIVPLTNRREAEWGMGLSVFYHF